MLYILALLPVWPATNHLLPHKSYHKAHFLCKINCCEHPARFRVEQTFSSYIKLLESNQIKSHFRGGPAASLRHPGDDLEDLDINQYESISSSTYQSTKPK